MKYIERLDKDSKEKLTELMRSSTSHKVRQRAHAIILSARKHKIGLLADIFDVDRDTISDWLKRWEECKFEGLIDAPRSGRPVKTRKKNNLSNVQNHQSVQN